MFRVFWARCVQIFEATSLSLNVEPSGDVLFRRQLTTRLWPRAGRTGPTCSSSGSKKSKTRAEPQTPLPTSNPGAYSVSLTHTCTQTKNVRLSRVWECLTLMIPWGHPGMINFNSAAQNIGFKHFCLLSTDRNWVPGAKIQNLVCVTDTMHQIMSGLALNICLAW